MDLQRQGIEVRAVVVLRLLPSAGAAARHRVGAVPRAQFPMAEEGDGETGAGRPAERTGRRAKPGSSIRG